MPGETPERPAFSSEGKWRGSGSRKEGERSNGDRAGMTGGIGGCDQNVLDKRGINRKKKERNILYRLLFIP